MPAVVLLRSPVRPGPIVRLPCRAVLRLPGPLLRFVPLRLPPAAGRMAEEAVQPSLLPFVLRAGVLRTLVQLRAQVLLRAELRLRQLG
jgi:hypothetical protein